MPLQIRFFPAHSFQFFRNYPFSFLLSRFPDFPTVMLRPGLFAHLRQQFFAKGFAAQTPTALNLFEILTVLRSPPPLHSGLELLSTSGTILGDPVLTE